MLWPTCCGEKDANFPFDQGPKGHCGSVNSLPVRADYRAKWWPLRPRHARVHLQGAVRCGLTSVHIRSTRSLGGGCKLKFDPQLDGTATIFEGFCNNLHTNHDGSLGSPVICILSS